MLLSVMHFAAENYHWPLCDVYDYPMVTLLLLMRQKLAMQGKPGISLQDKEMIDNVSWDELLKRNREQLYKRMQGK